MSRKFRNARELSPADKALAVQAGLKLNEGIALHQQGRLQEAVTVYSDILKIEPKHFDAIHLLGVIADQFKNYQLAADLIAQAISINPNHADAYFNRGNALKELNQLDAAVASYDKAIKLKPNYAGACNNRGIVLHKLNRFDAAVASYDKAVRIDPNYAEAYFNRGVALQELHRLDDALASFNRAATLKPDYAAAHYNSGVTLHKLDRFDDALASYDRAIALVPDYAEAHANRGVTLQELKRFDEALASCDAALAIRPDYAKAYCNRGNILKDLNRFDDAIASYNRALMLTPDDAETYSNRGLALQGLKRLDEALASHERAIALQPDNPKAHWNKGLTLLLRGDFENGWPMYEWRWHEANATSKPLATGKPRWTGAEKKRILVWAEQGIGDELMFSAMLPEMLSLCSRLIVKVDVRLIPLLGRSMSNEIAFVPSSAIVDENEYDEQIPMGSLCRYFRGHEASFGRTRDGYIADNKERTNSIKMGLQQSGSPGNKRCGISWRSKNEQSGANRSLTLKAFIDMLPLPSVDFVSLQYGDTDEEIERVRSESGVNVLSYKDVDNFHDIDGLASLIQACDFVVSVDNSTVHLAGALGRDTRVLLPFMPNWRWLIDRDDSPWYSSVKLYRQGSDRSWSGVFENVRSDLARRPGPE
jgi:tetratricopeptide (TPR) repeat protein